jgi:hypothetical protein
LQSIGDVGVVASQVGRKIDFAKLIKLNFTKDLVQNKKQLL